MPRWLAEDPIIVYSILGALALVVLAAAWMNRDRAIPLGSSKDRRKEPRTINALALGGIALLVLALLAGVVRLIDYLVLTDQEQIVLAVQETAHDIPSRDTERVFRHVSDSFAIPGFPSKKDFKEFARGYIERGEVQEVVVWDFSFEDVSPGTGTGTVSFLVKVKGSILGTRQDLFYRCEAKF